MSKLFFANGADGARAINLDLIQWASKNADGDVFLHFGKDDDNLTLRGRDAATCWEIINRMSLEGGRLGVSAEGFSGPAQEEKDGPSMSIYSPALRARRMTRGR